MYGCVLHPRRDNLNCSERNLSGRIFVLYLHFSTTWAVSHSTSRLDHLALPLCFARPCLGAGRPDSCTDKVGRIKCSLQTESEEIFSRMPFESVAKVTKRKHFSVIKDF